MIKKEWKFLQGVYKINIDQHFYVGSSVNVYKRLNVHLNSMKKNKHENQYLQRAFNKYGIDAISFELLEECKTATLLELRTREKYYIDTLKPDLNLKPDPVSEQNCITTSRKVYQFNLFGEFVKEWPSAKEVERKLHINTSNIHMCCTNPKRQRKSKNSYWSFTKSIPFDIEILYVYDINGKYINRYATTTDIYNDLFKDKEKKTVLSCLRKKINSNIPYDYKIFIFNHQNPDFDKIDLKKYQRKEWDLNAIVYKYDRQGNIIESRPLKDWPLYVRAKMLKSSRSCYSFGENQFISGNSKKIEVYDLQGNFIKEYPSAKLASIDLFGYNDGKNIFKHIKRNTPYKNYIFKRAF